MNTKVAEQGQVTEQKPVTDAILPEILDFYGITAETETVELSRGRVGYVLDKVPQGESPKPAGYGYQRASQRTATPTAGRTIMPGVFVVVASDDPSAPYLNEMANSIELNPFNGQLQMRYMTMINNTFVIKRSSPFSKFREPVVGLDVDEEGNPIPISDLENGIASAAAGPVGAATGGAFAEEGATA